MRVGFYQLEGVDAKDVANNKGEGGWNDDVIVMQGYAGMLISRLDAIIYNIRLRKFNKENNTNYRFVYRF